MRSGPKVFERPTLSGPMPEDEFSEIEKKICFPYYNSCTGTCTVIFFECEWAFTVGGIAAVGIDAAVVLAVV